MYRLNLLFIFAVFYFGMHLVSGYFYCADNFCPGDNMSDWVYEFKTEDGKSMIVVDGAPMPEIAYKSTFQPGDPRKENGTKE